MKPDGVDEEDLLAVGEGELAGCGVEGGKELVFDQHVGLGQGFEEGRFADVGVADDGEGGDAGP